MINLNKLEIFTVVARAGSFSAAAEQLLMTQPAVSQHVQDLEASLGTRLFARGRRGVTLTSAGSTLHGYARAIFDLVAEAENAITDVEHLATGHITVGATPGISVYLLPEPIQEFHSHYPKLGVTVATGITPQILADLRAGRLAFGLIEGEVDEPADSVVAVQPLQVVDQWLIVGPKHRWWGQAQVALAALRDETFIMRQRSSQTRIWLDGVLHQYGIQPRIGAEFDNVESIKRAVMYSTSITLLPEYAVRPDVETGRLWMLSIAGEPLQRTLKLVWNREGYLSPVTRAFLTCLRRYLPELEIGQVGTVSSPHEPVGKQ
jgi:DNA-binding transcriptional LysR family regulator